MKETGILFTPENHRGILNKTKWKTRRVMKPQPCVPEAIVCRLQDNEGGPDVWHAFEPAMEWTTEDYDICEPAESFHKCPFGHVGDRLYVKEGVIISKAFNPPALSGYYMDGCRVEYPEQKRLTAMFMPKRFARTWLEITDVKVERVKDISEEDARAEGATPDICKCDRWEYSLPGCEGCDHNYRRGFEKLWDSINGDKHPWNSNPFVWCLSFKVVKP